MNVDTLEAAVVWLSAHNMLLVVWLMVVCFHRPKWVTVAEINLVRKASLMYTMVTSSLLIFTSLTLMWLKGIQV